jgi:hypothetical protein
MARMKKEVFSDVGIILIFAIHLSIIKDMNFIHGFVIIRQVGGHDHRVSTPFEFRPVQKKRYAAANDDKYGEGADEGVDNVDDDDDNESETNIEPYGNRSLAWTIRYRKLIPYEKARRTAISFGLSSKEEWNELIQDGKGLRGPYMISRPDEMYLDEWESWEEFLGTMRPYEDARYIVQSVLKLRSMKEYISFVSNDTQRAELLRIPARPDIVYRESGWNPLHFFHDGVSRKQPESNQEDM